MERSYSELLELSRRFDGRSCDVIDKGSDSGLTRLDSAGTFRDTKDCCLVALCLWNHRPLPEKCTDDIMKDISCPSEFGSVNPRTCEKEEIRRHHQGEEMDTGRRENYYLSTEECCEDKLLLGSLTYERDSVGGCSSEEAWGPVCCPDGSVDSDLTA
jgi:hypothetical protein